MSWWKNNSATSPPLQITATQLIKPGAMIQVPRGTNIQNVIMPVGGGGGSRSFTGTVSGVGGGMYTTGTQAYSGGGGGYFATGIPWTSDPGPPKFSDEWLADYQTALESAQNERDLGDLGFVEVK